MDSRPGKKKYKRKEEAEDSNSSLTISINSIPSTIKITETTKTNRNHSALQISDLESLVSATDKTKEFKFQYTFN